MKTTATRHGGSVALGLAIAGALGAAGAHAADAPADGLGEIVVTARLVQESLQDVPLAISALDASALARRNIQDMRDLSYATAGLQLDTVGGKQFTTPVIRGLSQVSRIDDENNVGVFIDGVYVAGRDGLDASLLDVERVEVVRGPQSALYGRSTYAGAINYVTRKPDNQREAGASVTIGNQAKEKVTASLSGPIVEDRVFGRLAAAYDGYAGSYSNSTNPLRFNGYVSKFATGGLRFKIGDRLDVTANSYFAKDYVGPPAQVKFAGNCEPLRGVPSVWCGPYPSFDDSQDWSGYDSRAYGLRRQMFRNSVIAELSAGPVKITSISGYNTLHTMSLTDWDRQLGGRPYPLVSIATGQPAGTATLHALLSGGDATNGEFSQELRLGSATEAPLQWLVGGSYYQFTSRITSPGAIDTTPVPAGLRPAAQAPVGLGSAFTPVPACCFDERALFPRPLAGNVRKETHTWAGYGSLSYAVGPVTLRGEIRLTSEQKMLLQYASGSRSVETFRYWTPRYSADWKLRDGAIVYASVAKGAKAGGFNSTAPTPAELPFFPETNWTYEIGAKTDWLDRRVRVNVAAFDVEMDAIQISNPSPSRPATFITRNAGTGRSRGVEIEVVVKPIPALTVQASYSLADAKFVRATDSSLSAYPSFAANQDVSGNPLPRQAKHLANLSIEYRRPAFGDFEWYARSDGRYESKKYAFTAPRLGWAPDRTVVNVAFGVQNDHWDVMAWSRNLLNEDGPVLAQFLLTLDDFRRLPVAVGGELRTYGVTAGYRF